jgi:AraC-like DNA-binding protein
MSKSKPASVTPKIDTFSTPTLPPCNVPYRWILHVGRCVSVYFDKTQPQAVWEKHSHHEVQIVLFGTGAECTIHWEENGKWRREEITGQHLWIIGAGVPHKLEWRRETLRGVFYVTPEFASQSAGGEISGSVLLNFYLVAKCDAKILHLLDDFESMEQPATQPEFVHVESLSSLIIVRLLRAWLCLTQRNSGRVNAGLGSETLARIEQLIEERLDTKLLLVDMAREMGMSRSNLARLFKHRTGISLGQYLISRRIHRAKELLRSDEHRIGEIALSVGFSNQGHFDTFFKKLVGLTPREYRMSLQQDGHIS